MVASEMRRVEKANHKIIAAVRANDLENLEHALVEGEPNFQDAVRVHVFMPPARLTPWAAFSTVGRPSCGRPIGK